jgi:exosortase E/protease (VPEID-CTERM system)
VLSPRHLLGRLYILASILAIECILLASIPHDVGLFGSFARFGIVTFMMFIGLGHSTLKAQRDDLSFNGRLFAAHIFCIVAVCLIFLTALNEINVALSNAAPFVFRAVLLLGIALLALACVPFRVWIETVHITSRLWLYACGAGLFAAVLRDPFQSLWDGSIADRERMLQSAVFHSVHAVLQLFLPDISVDPSTFVIGTPRFAVTIADACSGMEGLGLILVFAIVWLWYFRREIRFPQAFLLVPIALGCMWFFNIVRICIIILIGDAGAPDVAMVGFHSQAGWIAFTLVALAFSMTIQRLSWTRKVPFRVTGSGGHLEDGKMTSREDALREIKEGIESSATAAYLVPFLAILAASFVSKSASGYFEWLYPLRFVAAVIAIWHFWPEYRKLNWRFGWMAPIAGLVIFLVWIAPAWWTHESSANPLEPALMALSPSMRVVWIVFRVAAAVITVPIAEELAFRGYLARRLIRRDFDAVPFHRLTVLSIGVSSVVFGLMHGQHWLVGTLAGVVYALVLKRKGRIGDAVAAHAVSNLLLAAWVLVRGDWAFW